MAVTGQAILREAFPVAEARDVVEGLVREHTRLVYRVAYSLLRHHEDAEDVAQETFIRVLRYGKRLGSVRDPRAWLARIAWRVALDRKRRPPEISMEEAADAVRELGTCGLGAEQIAQSRQMMQLLEHLIATLPRKLRKALILSTVEELSAAEVGEVLQIPEASVRTRVFRARQLLRLKLTAVVEGKHAP
ncbi:MAG: RNA polymerase sigma factor [Acidobacteria bacterium]|nr:RNA polymerase sigma factor [Acidobacteriota bacterium]